MYKTITVSWEPFKGSLEQELNKLPGQVIQLLGKPGNSGVRFVGQEYPSQFQSVLIWEPKEEEKI